MTRSASGFFRLTRRGLVPTLALAATLGVGGVMGAGGAGGAGGATQPQTAEELRRERARQRLEDSRPAQERAAELPRVLPPIDPALVDWYRAMVTELADPAYEGRAPGSAGIAKAADLIEARFKELGLKPLFSTSTLASDGTEVLTARSSYRQPFGIGEEVDLVAASMTVDGEALTPGVDFSTLAYSGSGEVSAPVVFTGYSIVSGPGGFMGFEPSMRLEGEIALCLKYEPMDEQGRSLWDKDGFSNHSAMTHKASALIRRGAGAVLIVAPGHALDERAGVLETVASTRMGRPGLDAEAPRFDAPVLNITPEAAQRIIDGAGDPDLTLASLVERANRGAVFQELGERPVSVSVTMNTVENRGVNIGAVLPGVGELGDEVVVIGAHYDHVGYGLRNSRDPENAGALHPGADDNASGTAGMMLAAQLVSERLGALPPDRPRRSVVFLAFSAEEMGLLGSRHYVEHPAVPIGDHVLMLNLDMIGRLESDLLEIGGLDSAPGLEDLADPFIEASALPVARDVSLGSGRSDHASFDAEQVPNLFFFTGLHEDYHQPGDTADQIDSEGGVRVALLVTDIALEAATRTQAPVHRRLADRADQGSSRPTVRLGILPTNSTKGGVLVQRVFPDTSASQAGIQPDDRILTWNGQTLGSTEDLRPMLSTHKPGDQVVLTVERGGEVIELTMTLRAIE